MAPFVKVLMVAAIALALMPVRGHADPRLAPQAPQAKQAPLAEKAPQAEAIEVAQGYGLPPDNVGGDNSGGGGGDASLVVRVGQLEEQVRQLNGKIEQLQFANHQLEDQLKKFQEDVEFRFQELSHKGGVKSLPKHSDAGDTMSSGAMDATATSAPPPTATATALTTPASPATPSPRNRDDAFDPTKNPNAAGAPRALGGGPLLPSAAATPAAGVVASSDDAPINLLSSPQAGPGSPTPPGGAGAAAGAPASPPPSTGPATAPAAAHATTPAGTVIADAHAEAPKEVTKEEFDIALGYLKQKDYDNAERSFSAFLAKNPKGRRTSDALYYLGESYFLRGRHREAAEQYLKISSDYASSPRAPEAMLRLGESLHALGAKEQACATFGEISRKYPNASAGIKAGAEREAKKASC